MPSWGPSQPCFPAILGEEALVLSGVPRSVTLYGLPIRFLSTLPNNGTLSVFSHAVNTQPPLQRALDADVSLEL